MQKRIGFLSFFILVSTCFLWGQNARFATKTGTISFYSKAPLEKIEATNKSVFCVIDGASGRMEFSLMMKGFEFEKSLMQDHFNENYMESSTYPKALFKGEITNPSAVKWTQDGTYSVTVKGDLTIKGKTKNVSAPGKITISNGKVTANSTFNVQLTDFGVAIPAVNKDNISNTIEIKVNCVLAQM